MHRPFDGFSCEFTSIANCFNLQFIVGTARRTRVRRRARSCAMQKPHKTSFRLFCTIFKPPLGSWTDFLNSPYIDAKKFNYSGRFGVF